MRLHIFLSNQGGASHFHLSLTAARRSLHFAVALLCSLGALLLPAGWALADVTSIDDVWLEEMTGVFTKDNPFTLQNEGIPTTGNTIDPFQGMAQTNYEGRPNATGTANINFNIIVGRVYTGQLILSGAFSVLRDQDLIIGDSEEMGMPGQEITIRGDGTVRIEGNGALFNNDPTIFPWPATESPSVNPRQEDLGFDVYVGRGGTGLLRMSLGGRAEVQDAFIVGHLSGSTGRVEVDGFDTVLQSGGFAPETPDPEEVHQMVIGRQGIGVMDILNGGRVIANVSEDSAVGGTLIGAVIGSDPYQIDQDPEPASQGRVTLAGNGSQWTIRGALQVGGFNGDDGDDPDDIDDIEGEMLEYAPTAGKGTLEIGAGALVSVLPADTEVLVFPLEVVVGRYGMINLTGGQLVVGSNIGSDEEAGVIEDNVRVINDGRISGYGNIDTGIFRNRFFGEVEVTPGQKLVVTALSTFEDLDEDAPPMVNWGVIRVIGTSDFRAELEFDRAPTSSGLPAPFENRQLTVVPLSGRTGGLIHVQNGVLRFRTGLTNQSNVAFTGGDNLVIGDVVNLPSDGMMLSDGVITVDGVGTHVLFEDNLDNGGILDISATAVPVDILGDFTTSGTLQLELASGLPFRLNIVDDAILDGILQVSLVGLSPGAGDAFGVLSATGDLSGIFTGQVFPTLAAGLGWTVDYDYVVDAVTLRVLSTAMVIGADFNGDGVIDLEDLAILEMNFGITMGATALQGDADGDGDVDGDDYDIWLITMMPGAGSGAGGEHFAAVPEPSSLTLVALASMLAFAFRRGRQ